MILREELPVWLRAWKRNKPISASDLCTAFFSSRVVYYPGSGTDGQPVQYFGAQHSAHCFVLVDYGITRDHVLHELGEAGHPFAGYARIGQINVGTTDLTRAGWVPYIRPEGAPSGPPAADGPYVFIEILERTVGLDDTHGPERLAILFLCADGVAAYDALFCQTKSRAPFAVVLQDHGWGDNWTCFGSGGVLDQLAQKTGRLPEYLLVARNTEAWPRYSAVEGTAQGGGGMHGFVRELWQRT